MLDRKYIESMFSADAYKELEFTNEGSIANIIAGIKALFSGKDMEKSNFKANKAKEDSSNKDDDDIEDVKDVSAEESSAREQFIDEMTSDLYPKLSKIINESKLASMFYIYTNTEVKSSNKEDFIKDAITNDLYIADYNVWEHPDIKTEKYKDEDKDSILQKIVPQIQDTMDKMLETINGSGWGKAEIIGDWDDGSIMISASKTKIEKYKKASAMESVIVSTITGSKPNFSIKENAEIESIINSIMNGAINETATYEPTIGNLKQDVKDLEDTKNFFYNFADELYTDLTINEPLDSTIDSVFKSNYNSDDIFNQHEYEDIKVNDALEYNKIKFINGTVNICFIARLDESIKHIQSSDSVVFVNIEDAINNADSGSLNSYKSNELLYSFFKSIGSKYFGTKEQIIKNEIYIRDVVNEFVDFSIRYANAHRDKRFIIDSKDYLCRFVPVYKLMNNTSVMIKESTLKDNIGSIKTIARRKEVLDEFSNKFINSKNTNKTFDIRSEDALILNNNSNEYIEESMYFEYLEALIENEIKLKMQRDQLVLSEAEMVVLKENVLESIMNTWDAFCDFIMALFGKFKTNVTKILTNNQTYLDNNRNIILNKKWSNITTVTLNGDYNIAEDRIRGLAVPRFDYEKYKEALKEESYEPLLKSMTSGKDFNYTKGTEETSESIANQFKSYFIGADRGENTIRFSDLNPQKLFDFCYNVNNLLDLVSKDIDTIKKSKNALNSACNKIHKEFEDKKRAEGENANTNPDESKTTTPESSAPTNGDQTGATPGQNQTGASQQSTDQSSGASSAANTSGSGNTQP